MGLIGSLNIKTTNIILAHIFCFIFIRILPYIADGPEQASLDK